MSICYSFFLCYKPEISGELVLILEQFVSAIGKPQVVLSEESLAERNVNRTGGASIELSSRAKDSFGRTLKYRFFIWLCVVKVISSSHFEYLLL